MNSTLKFWIQFTLFAIFGCIAPLGFIIWRFELFQVVSKTTFGVWGVICLVIVAIFGSYVARYLTKGIPYSFGTQIINGVFKVVVPCLLVWVLSYKLKDEMDLFIQVMAFITCSEAIAICVNPLPKYGNHTSIPTTNTTTINITKNRQSRH